MRKQTELEKQHLKAIQDYCDETGQSVKTLFRKEVDCFNTAQVDGYLKGTKDFGSKKICQILDKAGYELVKKQVR